MTQDEDHLRLLSIFQMDKFIHIRSPKFPILPGEKDELVNEGMYGKAVAAYLQVKLRDRGYEVPFFCCEDWGWWVELKNAPFGFGVCIYCGPGRDGPLDFFCTDGAVGRRKWSWRRFRFVQGSGFRVPPLHAPGPVSHRAEPPLHAPEPALHRAEPPLHAPEPALHRAEPPLHAPEPVLHRAELPLHAPEPALHRAEPPLHAPEPALHRAEPPLHAAEPVSHRAEPLLHASALLKCGVAFSA
jgi:hypothetical protein